MTVTGFHNPFSAIDGIKDKNQYNKEGIRRKKKKNYQPSDLSDIYRIISSRNVK